MKDRGFAIVELAAVVGIMSVLLVIALPQYVRARTRDREAEVKANIRTIQIALERYAVDSDGFYPAFLVGAERDSNIIRCSIDLSGNFVSQFPVAGVTPFCRRRDSRLYEDSVITMDPLIQWGYLSEYPVNPFARPDSGLWNAYSETGGSGVFPYGGVHGDKMFDLGFGWGDTPQTDFVLYTTESIEEFQAQANPGRVFADPDLDAPGDFYYHPVFNDLIPVYFHYAADYESWLSGETGDPRTGIVSDMVDGYFLYGYGAPGNRDSFEEGGLDYFNRMPRKYGVPKLSPIFRLLSGMVLDSSVGAMNQQRVESTGYPAWEYDPWTGAFPRGIDPMNPSVIQDDRISGPDGVNDWVIIEATSSLKIRNSFLSDSVDEGR